MWVIATDDGVIQAREINIHDDGVIHIKRKDMIVALSSSVISGTTPTCPEDILPLVLSSVGVKDLIEVSIPWERVRFIIHAKNPPKKPKPKPKEKTGE